MATSKRKTTPTPPLLAYVLHRHDWSESSLIVELFTRERGRLVVAAKGAKRPYSQLRPVLMPFQRVLVQLGRTPGDDSVELHNLRSAEWAGGVPHISGAALFAGFYVNELVLKLLPRDDAHATLFDAYVQTLAALHPHDDAATQRALRAFELRLLRELGWLPELHVVTALPWYSEHRIESGWHTAKPETLSRLAEALDMRFVMGFESGPAENPTRELVTVSSVTL